MINLFFTNKKLKNQILISKLEQFGLDPAEWSLMPVSKDAYKINHTTDSKLSFYGETTKGDQKLDWKYIQLLDL